MGRCAALLLLALASLPGCGRCGLTGLVWSRRAILGESPEYPLSVRISPGGDVAILYESKVQKVNTPATAGLLWHLLSGDDRQELASGGDLFECREVSRRRGLVVPAAEMQRLLAAGSGGTGPVVVGGKPGTKQEADLARLVRPADPRSTRNFRESSVPGLDQWREVLRAPWGTKSPDHPGFRIVDGTGGRGIEFAYGKKGETDGGEGPGKAKEVTVRMLIPGRDSPAVRGYPLRVLLTPPAVLVDAAKDVPAVALVAATVVTAPVWVPILWILWPRDMFKGHWSF